MEMRVGDFPLISVIVPVYNVEKYLERCFESIKNQSYKNIEIILVNDGSQDCSGEICEKLKKTDMRTKVIHKKNGGLSSARNAGLEIAEGEYIGFVDSDDWIDCNMYEALYNNINKFHTKISCCGRYNVDAKTGEKAIGLCPENEELILVEEGLKRLLKWDNIDSSAVDKLFHRSVFEHFRFPMGVISEDVAIMYQIFAWVGALSLVPLPMYYYYHRENSITMSKFDERKLVVLEHSNKILDFVKEKYPGAEMAAYYFRYTQLIFVYDGIVNSRAYTDKNYKKLLYEISGEIKQNREKFKYYLVTRAQKSKAIFVTYPILYIVLKRLRSKKK